MAVVAPAALELFTNQRAVVRFVLVHLAKRLPLGSVPRPVVQEHDQRLRAGALGLEHAVEELVKLGVGELSHGAI